MHLPRLLPALAIGRAYGSYAKTLARLAKTDVLLIDDWGLAPLTDESRRDLLEIFDERHGMRSTIITSQLPVKHWHEAIGDPMLADAILDRLAHQAHSLNLDGKSLRKKTNQQVPRLPPDLPCMLTELPPEGSPLGEPTAGLQSAVDSSPWREKT